MKNNYFDENSYRNDIALDVNKDVLSRIHNDSVTRDDKLPIEFYFLTDTAAKATHFATQLKLKFPEYSSISVGDYDGDFEINGITTPIQMDLLPINSWNKLMWDFGYQYDCKLDGWQVGT